MKKGGHHQQTRPSTQQISASLLVAPTPLSSPLAQSPGALALLAFFPGAVLCSGLHAFGCTPHASGRGQYTSVVVVCGVLGPQTVGTSGWLSAAIVSMEVHG
jgi:hypothetical protein